MRRHFRPAIAAPLAVAIAASLLPPAGRAATADQVRAPLPSADAAAVDLDRIEVVGEPEYHYVERRTASATRTDTLLIDVPQAVTVVTGDVIDDTAMRGLADVVQYVPGAGMAQGEGHRDAPVLRGNTSTADLFVNGMRDDVQYFRDLYNVDRVEVLKGPNAMAFGRGGTGGAINRVTRQADWRKSAEATVQAGSWDRRRVTLDLGDAVSGTLAVRASAMAEDSGSFRDDVRLRRRGVNPAVAVRIGEGTLLHADFEHFEDERVTDRGIPSQATASADGRRRPVQVARSTFFGDPDNSPAEVSVDALNVLVEHGFRNGALLRNRTRWADYDKSYQNVFPVGPAREDATSGAVEVPIGAYNSATARSNLLNQTDFVLDLRTGPVAHSLLAGFELGRQESDNRRMTGRFPASACQGIVTTAATCVTLADPRYGGPTTFFQAGSDADNRVVARGAAAYLQDQVQFSPRWHAIVGLRHDRFEVDFHDRRNGSVISTGDSLWSPRVGIIYKPGPAASFYASHGLTYLPRAGEQMSSLTPSNASLDPERYENREVGAKWDIRPDLNVTAAAYRLERENVAVPDPSDPTRSLLVDGERIQGLELGVAGNITGNWRVIGGYARQSGRILTGSHSGNRPANLPGQAASLWNRFDVADAWGVGFGVIHRDEMFAHPGNAVVLEGYTRYDAAVYYTPSERVAVQLNIENLTDRRYIASAHNDNNLLPGSPRAATLGVTVRF